MNALPQDTESTARPTAGNSTLRLLVLLAATVTTGLTAGVFFDWSNAVMPGLGDLDDRAFVTAFRALDRAIVGPLFIGVGFTGALLLTAVSAVLHRRPKPRPGAGPAAGAREPARTALRWIVAALVFLALAWVITVAVHEPLNQELRSFGELTTEADWAEARAALDEKLWTVWNTVRAVVTTLAFVCLARALALPHGPGPAPDPERSRPRRGD
ncbi:DUF1772 domain-containing protein [Streptomyces sp. XM4193]|uniref:anthrone oxygenase family protein n=1 Tax=Streptomyces sp. XM4193 TaxID=2929782 RepID=UPI001FFBD8C8|nr:DUF1772 domain-containing protein [Streptomyces sp. XM4193]MCK1794640.1 DUF1772 domain-containing protein [Streptomyces sp. XM4193]